MNPLTSPAALLNHVWRAMTLRHDLQDVPTERDGSMFTLVALVVGAALVRWCLTGSDPNALGLTLTVGLGMAVCSFLMPVQVFSVCALASIGVDLVGALLTFIGLDAQHGLINFALLGWLVASCSTAQMTYRRAGRGGEPK